MINSKELIEQYPKIKLKDKTAKLHIMGEDVYTISRVGRIERIVSAKIVKCSCKNKSWFELDILKTELIDAGIAPEDVL